MEVEVGDIIHAETADIEPQLVQRIPYDQFKKIYPAYEYLNSGSQSEVFATAGASVLKGGRVEGELLTEALAIAMLRKVPVLTSEGDGKTWIQVPHVEGTPYYKFEMKMRKWGGSLENREQNLIELYQWVVKQMSHEMLNAAEYDLTLFDLKPDQFMVPVKTMRRPYRGEGAHMVDYSLAQIGHVDLERIQSICDLLINLATTNPRAVSEGTPTAEVLAKTQKAGTKDEQQSLVRSAAVGLLMENTHVNRQYRRLYDAIADASPPTFLNQLLDLVNGLSTTTHWETIPADVQSLVKMSESSAKWTAIAHTLAVSPKTTDDLLNGIKTAFMITPGKHIRTVVSEEQVDALRPELAKTMSRLTDIRQLPRDRAAQATSLCEKIIELASLAHKNHVRNMVADLHVLTSLTDPVLSISRGQSLSQQVIQVVAPVERELQRRYEAVSPDPSIPVDLELSHLAVAEQIKRLRDKRVNMLSLLKGMNKDIQDIDVI